MENHQHDEEIGIWAERVSLDGNEQWFYFICEECIKDEILGPNTFNRLTSVKYTNENNMKNRMQLTDE